MKPALFVTALLMLTACDAGSESRRVAMEDADEGPATVSITPALTAAGPGETLAPDPDEYLQWTASVVDVDYLENQGGQNTIKLFGTAGGDPAMNGLYTHIAFFAGVADGWRVFRLGDFLEYRIVAEAPGRVDLEITESTLDPATDEISSRTRRLIVSWTPVEGGAPESISVAPAR